MKRTVTLELTDRQFDQLVIALNTLWSQTFAIENDEGPAPSLSRSMDAISGILEQLEPHWRDEEVA